MDTVAPTHTLAERLFDCVVSWTNAYLSQGKDADAARLRIRGLACDNIETILRAEKCTRTSGLQPESGPKQASALQSQ